LKIDFKPHLNPERKTFVRNELINALRVAFGLRFDVQEAQPGEIPRFELKAIRFKDLRTKG
jgi:phenylacetate-coenzyme A ligase PaaK-like adenylate-forming protein